MLLFCDKPKTSPVLSEETAGAAVALTDMESPDTEAHRALSCPQCRVIFPPSRTLKIYTNAGDMIHTCPSCNKIFNQPVNQGDALFFTPKIDGEKTWLCILKKFESVSDMDAYLEIQLVPGMKEATAVKNSRKKPKDRQQFPCPHCGKVFCVRAQLTRHISSHTKGHSSKKSSAPIQKEEATSMQAVETHLLPNKPAEALSSETDCTPVQTVVTPSKEMHIAADQPIEVSSSERHFTSVPTIEMMSNGQSSVDQSIGLPSNEAQFTIDQSLKIPSDKTNFILTEPCTKSSAVTHVASSETLSSDSVGFDSSEKQHDSIDAEGIHSVNESVPMEKLSGSEHVANLREGKTKSGRKRRVVDKKFKCTECDRAFEWKLHYERHILGHRTEKPFQCNHCDEKFKKIGELNKHVIEDHLICEKCHKQFENEAEIQEHMLTHKKKVHICPHCSKEFNIIEKFRRHVTKHTGEKPHMCHECGKNFRSYSNMYRHMRIHKGDKPYACPQCDKRFVQPQTLKEHIEAHSAEKHYECKVCGKAFGRRGNLYVHMKSHQKDGQDPDRGVGDLTCSICGAMYKYAAMLHQHMAVHSGEEPMIKPYQCPLCDKSYTHATGLYSHTINIHESKRVSCPYCSKEFQKYALKKHMLIHTGEKPHKCETCGRGFASLGNMKRHMGTHNDGNLFVCGQCSKRFSNASSLKTHMDTHLNKPYQCLECKMRFEEEAKLARHKCFRSRLKLHLCQHCGKGFNRPWLLRKHKCPASAENTQSVSNVNEPSLNSLQHVDEDVMVHNDAMSLPLFPNF